MGYKFCHLTIKSTFASSKLKMKVDNKKKIEEIKKSLTSSTLSKANGIVKNKKKNLKYTLPSGYRPPPLTEPLTHSKTRAHHASRASSSASKKSKKSSIVATTSRRASTSTLTKSSFFIRLHYTFDNYRAKKLLEESLENRVKIGQKISPLYEWIAREIVDDLGTFRHCELDTAVNNCIDIEFLSNSNAKKIYVHLAKKHYTLTPALKYLCDSRKGTFGAFDFDNFEIYSKNRGSWQLEYSK